MAKHTRQTNKIAVFLDIAGLARTRAISGLYRYARQKPKWRIFQFPLWHDCSTLRQITKKLKPDAIFASHVDAIKAFSPHPPYVLMENVESIIPSGHNATLNLDNIAIGYSAAEKLYSLGYRNFGYLGIIFNPSSHDERMPARYSKMRCSAFERRIHEFGYSISCYTPKFDNCSYNEKAITSWLKSLAKPCGILAFSDEDAQYAISLCREARIPIPKQVGIIGVDNEAYICDNVIPPLTSIEPDYEGAGYRAGELIDEFLAGNYTHDGAREYYGIATIENRMSAQSITAAANRVSHATEIIRSDPANAPSPIAIARQLNLSLRVLELAFKQIRGHGIASEILSQRLALSKRLLKSSHASIGEIASRCGFASHASFLSSFRRRFGTTPREWRRG